MLEGVNFSYDGISSVDMGLINVMIDGGMFEEIFLPTREIQEIAIDGRDKRYFQGVSLEPLEFSLTFAFEYGYTPQKIREVARWLNQSYYKPFYTTDNPNRIFYCMMNGESTLVHNGMKEGYITLSMKCDSPYSYTPEYIRENYSFVSTKLVKSFEESTFNSDMGDMKDIKVNDNNNLVIKNSNPIWSFYTGKKWSEI